MKAGSEEIMEQVRWHDQIQKCSDGVVKFDIQKVKKDRDAITVSSTIHWFLFLMILAMVAAVSIQTFHIYKTYK